MSLNKVMLIGHIGSALELRHTTNGNPVVNLSIATEDKWRDKNTGNLMTETEWHRIVVWGNQATSCANHLKVGSRVHVEGKLKTKKWDDNGVTRYTTEVHSSNVIFLGNSKKEQAAEQNQGVAIPITTPVTTIPVVGTTAAIDPATLELATKMAAQIVQQQNATTLTAPVVPVIEEAYTDEMADDVPF